MHNGGRRIIRHEAFRHRRCAVSSWLGRGRLGTVVVSLRSLGWHLDDRVGRAAVPAGGARAADGRYRATPAAATAVPRPDNQTLRQIVHVSAGGDRVRVVLTNAFGTAPLVVGAAHIALREKDSAIVAASDRVLTFSGKSAPTIPAGASLVSNPVSLTVPAFADVAIDLFVPEDTGAQPLTMHRAAHQTSYLSRAGNHAGAAEMADGTTVTSWYFLGDVEVMAPEGTAVVVALGDSITDGSQSTLDANLRWPDLLARRLPKTAVLNAGIGGNRLLSEGTPESGINILARFDRDVLLQAGVTHVIVLEGINDIGNAREHPSPSADDLICGASAARRAGACRGLKIFGATLTPFEGAAYATHAGEAKRQALNDWIRPAGAYDGVIDFDAVIRDPQQPTRMLATYDSGDHLHPSDAGYQAMGNAIDPALFASRRARRKD